MGGIGMMGAGQRLAKALMAGMEAQKTGGDIQSAVMGSIKATPAKSEEKPKAKPASQRKRKGGVKMEKTILG